MNDDRIIELYLERSEQAIEETYQKYSAYCNSISFNILQNKEDAEECVNDTFKKVWDSIPPNTPDNFKAYLARIVKNISLNRLKSSKTEKRGGGQRELLLSELEECISDRLSVEATLDEKNLVEVLNRFLTELTTEKRKIFIGRYWYMYSIDELAEQHSMNESRVRSMLFRLRKKLSKYLEKEGIFYEG